MINSPCVIDTIKDKSEKNIKINVKKNIVLNKRYTIIKKIAEGGFCDVFLASDIYDEYFKETRNIIIKYPNKKLIKNKDIYAFTYSEYTILRTLNHDNIVKVLDFGIDEEKKIPYIVMEYLEGILLGEKNYNLLTKKNKDSIYKELYNSILYLHKNDIIHADITPNNIIIQDDGTLKLIDFGISQNIKNIKKYSLEFTKLKAFNPKYCSPKILDGCKPTINSDFFSFACIIYELYNGSSLFTKSSSELINLNINKQISIKIPFLKKSKIRKYLTLI